MKNKKKKGFTLIEMMAVIAILGIFISLIFSLFTSSSSMLYAAEKDNVLQNEARTIVDVLEEEIKYTPKIKTGVTPNVIEISKVVGGVEEKYKFGIKDNEFKKFNDTTDFASLSKHVKEFSVARAKDEGGAEIENLYEIYIKLEAGSKSNYEYKTRIKALNCK